MGLLTKEVEITSNCGASYYESLGYIFPRRLNKWGKYTIPKDAKIKIDINHLKTNSHIKVLVECDCCHKTKEILYTQYTHNNRDGKYFCYHCNRKENHYSWNPNKTQEERENGRNIDGYLDFIKTVSERDNYICRCYGKKCSGDLNVHHLNGYNWFKPGRIDPQNAVVLCDDCHENFHLIYGKGNNTKEQFEEWIGYALEELELYNGILPRARKVYCVETDTVYNSALDASKQLNINISRIYFACNHKIHLKKHKNVLGQTIFYKTKTFTSNGKHMLWYDEYIKMSQQDIDNYLKKCVRSDIKKVYCITTGKIFESITDAQKYYNCSKHVWDCCKGKRQTCGQLPDGTRLRWMYYDDYLKLQDKQTA